MANMFVPNPGPNLGPTPFRSGYQSIFVDKFPVGMKEYKPIPQKFRFDLDKVGVDELADPSEDPDVCHVTYNIPNILHTDQENSKDSLNKYFDAHDIRQERCQCYQKNIRWFRECLHIMNICTPCKSPNCIFKKWESTLLYNSDSSRTSSAIQEQIEFNISSKNDTSLLDYFARFVTLGILPSDLLVDHMCCSEHWSKCQSTDHGIDITNPQKCKRKYLETTIAISGLSSSEPEFDEIRGKYAIYKGKSYEILNPCFTHVPSRSITFDDICQWSCALLPLMIQYNRIQGVDWSSAMEDMRYELTLYNALRYISECSQKERKNLCIEVQDTFEQNITMCWPHQEKVYQSPYFMNDSNHISNGWLHVLGYTKSYLNPDWNLEERDHTCWYDVPCLESIQTESRFLYHTARVQIMHGKKSIITGLKIFGVGILEVSLLLETSMVNPQTGTRSYFAIPFDCDENGVWTFGTPLVRDILKCYYYCHVYVRFDETTIGSEEKNTLPLSVQRATAPLLLSNNKGPSNKRKRTKYICFDYNIAYNHSREMDYIDLFRPIAHHILSTIVANKCMIHYDSLDQIHIFLQRSVFPDLFDNFALNIRNDADDDSDSDSNIIGSSFDTCYFSSSEDEDGNPITREYRLNVNKGPQSVSTTYMTRSEYRNTFGPKIEDALSMTSGPIGCRAYHLLEDDAAFYKSTFEALDCDQKSRTRCSCHRCGVNGCIWPHIHDLESLCDNHIKELLPRDTPWAFLTWSEVGTTVTSNIVDTSHGHNSNKALRTVLSVFGHEWELVPQYVPM